MNCENNSEENNLGENNSGENISYKNNLKDHIYDNTLQLYYSMNIISLYDFIELNLYLLKNIGGIIAGTTVTIQDISQSISTLLPNLTNLELNCIISFEINLSDCHNIKKIELRALFKNPITKNINLNNCNNLISLTLSDFTQVTELDLSSNLNLEILAIYRLNIDNLDLQNNNKLKRIDINSSKIKYIELNSPQLETLDLENTLISDIDFANTPNITKLSLLKNKNIDIDFIFILKKLLRLELSYININLYTLVEDIHKNLPELKTLSISKKHISTSIPRALNGLPPSSRMAFGPRRCIEAASCQGKKYKKRKI